MRKPIDEFYRIGLDIGIASIGWACLACDKKGEVKHILDLGVRAFDIPENAKDGNSPAAPRREKRSLRRRLRRSAHRLERARALLGIKKENPNDYKKTVRVDVYELRVKALDEKISEEDFARVLMLILKRRGYSSNSNNADKEESKLKKEIKEEGKLKEAIKENEDKMRDKKYRTVGEMLYTEGKNESNGIKTLNVRNHGDYKLCVTREMLKEELRLLFSAQRKFGNCLASEQTERDFLTIFMSQRNFDEGPGKGSSYSAEYAVGKCPFEKGELRAAKATFSFEYFRLLQSLNNLKICSGGREYTLNNNEFQTLKGYCMFKDNVKYSDLRKKLKLREDEYFAALTYGKKNSDAEKAKFGGMPECSKIRKALNGDNIDNIELYDEIGDILSKSKSIKKRMEKFAESAKCAILTEEEKEQLVKISCSGFGHMSIKAIKKVIPFLEQGLVYSEAMGRVGYDHSNPYGGAPKAEKLNLNDAAFRVELADIMSPAVRRAVSQTVKTVNAIIDKYGSPIAINIELARELGKSKPERSQIKKENDERWKENESNMQKLKDRFGISNPTGKQLIKYLLYEEQDGKCIYSGKGLDIERVMKDEKYAEVDHIIPYSRSFCDAMYNKVLVLIEENQQKGNKIPKEYFGGNIERWEEFESRVNATYAHDRRKRGMLLRDKFTNDNGKEWKDRSLNDTRYITKFMFNTFRNRLMFADCDMGKKRVFSVNGIVTSFVRKLWGIRKERENGDLHHCVDAAVIGCITDGFTQSLTKWSKRREIRYAFTDNAVIDAETGEVITPQTIEDFPDRLPKPHDKFIDELEMRLSEKPENYEQEYYGFGYDGDEVTNVRKVFVSRAPERKAKGQIHLETVYSRDNAGKATLKKPLTDLKLENGEIKDYNEFAKKDDRLLYEALKTRLIEYGGNAKEAFAEPFHKPKADGSDGPIVKKVIINQNISAPVKLDRGSAKNDAIVRVDVFEREGKFYGVPIYVYDVYKGVLPNKAVVAGKDEKDWLEMTEEYKFKFSLYKNDLVYIESEKDMAFKKTNGKDKNVKNITKTLAYYKSFDRATAAMDFILHDNSYLLHGKGIQKLKNFEKFAVDMLGNTYKVGCEKRSPMGIKSR